MKSTSSLRSNIPDRHAMPMSTVPPSPPWPMTRTSLRPLTFSAAAMPVATAGAFAEQRVQPRHLPRGLRVGRREDLQAAGRVGGDQLPVGRAHRGVERVARAERLAAALAGAVALGDRVAAVGVGLHRAQLGVEQAVAGRVASHLVELDRSRAAMASDRPGGDDADVAQHVLGVRPRAPPGSACARARARRARCRGRGR